MWHLDAPPIDAAQRIDSDLALTHTRYCLKYQAPDTWRVQKSDGLSILKASIELLGPNWEEHYLPSEGLSLFVLSTSDWERAVFRCH